MIKGLRKFQQLPMLRSRDKARAPKCSASETTPCRGILASEHPQNTAIFEGVQMVMKPCQVLKEILGTPIHGQKSPERPTDSPRSRSF